MFTDTPSPFPPFVRATFAAGCFWGVEEIFRQQPGVIDVRVGYTGGHAVSPTYREVCQDTTGHAEAVEVTFDPTRTSYECLLDVFWGCHDPTQRNRQGPDVGSQYRSAIFFHDATQEAAARASFAREESSGRHARRLSTEIVPAGVFWAAEAYHQQYLRKYGYLHGRRQVC